MRFTEQLRRQTADLRLQVLEHPFVKGIGDGDLPLESFRFYMCQDYVFLVDYCRVLALAVAKADDLETMGRFAGLLHETLNTEMDLHRGFAAKFGISAQELEDTQGAPGDARVHPTPSGHRLRRGPGGHHRRHLALHVGLQRHRPGLGGAGSAVAPALVQRLDSDVRRPGVRRAGRLAA